jgi:hypothetical protein
VGPAAARSPRGAGAITRRLVAAATPPRDGWRCCDNGTLTKPIGKQVPAELKLRPDFRICQDAAIEIDCGLLHDMHGHTANVVGLGEEFNGPFNAHREEARAH